MTWSRFWEAEVVLTTANATTVTGSSGTSASQTEPGSAASAVWVGNLPSQSAGKALVSAPSVLVAEGAGAASLRRPRGRTVGTANRCRRGVAPQPPEHRRLMVLGVP